MDRLEQEVKHENRNGLAIAVSFLDLDGFKNVNDSLGHEVGDRLLSDVAEHLIDCVREDDTVSRLGGDEFTVILVGAKHRKDVERVAQAIIGALAIPFHIAQELIKISVSIGITFYPQYASSSTGLLEASDKAMYNAKTSAYKRICFFDSLNKSHG